MKEKRIGEILIEQKFLTEETIKDVLAEQDISMKKFGEILVEKGLIAENKLIEIIAKQKNYYYINNLDEYKVVGDKTKTASFYWGNCCVLAEKDGEVFFIFNSNSADINAYITAISLNGVKIALSVKEVIYRFLSSNITPVENTEADIITKINDATEIAIIKKSSNIRIKKNNSSYMIIIDTDTGVEIIKMFSIPDGEKVINILKELCKGTLKPGQPLDAQYSYMSILSKKKVDIRVVFLPVSSKTDDKNYYEAVLRIHGLNTVLTLESLGFSQEEIDMLSNVFTYSSGLILTAGPTGAGKSTTNNSLLKELAKKRLPILTIEDPVEIKLNETNITQMSISDNFRYEQAITTSLRCEPKIIFIGEIRDKETALAVIKAAQTGHLVLSTIHTNSAINIVSRIKGMGVNVEEFLEVIKLGTSQRLYLPLCPHCREKRQISSLNKIFINSLKTFGINEFIDNGIKVPNEVYVSVRGNDCPACYGSGYLPKKPIIEILPFTEDVIETIKAGKKVKYETLKDKALKLFKEGLIDVNQLINIAG
jgi:type II secretory ATPase GspE/PulE/Tfp pilus assembly ATPase PilB-like protein